MKEIIWNHKNLKDKYPSIFYQLSRFYEIDDIVNENKLEQKNILLNNIIENKIVNSKNYKLYWETNFLDKLSKVINHKVVGATYGIGPSLGGKIILMTDINTKKSKELVFFISLITNYYSVQIVTIDKYFINNNFYTNKEAWGVENVVVSSIPTDDGKLFDIVEKFICDELVDAKFFPFIFDTIKLNNFIVPYKYVYDFSTISDGFFNKGLILHENTKIIGDINYKIDKI